MARQRGSFFLNLYALLALGACSSSTRMFSSRGRTYRAAILRFVRQRPERLSGWLRPCCFYLPTAAFSLLATVACGLAESSGDVCRASSGDLVLSEVMAVPAGSAAVEWIEIYNASAVAQPLDGVLIAKGDPSDPTRRSELVVRGAGALEAGEYAIVASGHGSETFEARYVWDGAFGLLGNDGATLELGCQGTVVDAVTYGSAGVGNASEGFSLSLDGMWSPHAGENDRPSRWCNAQSLYDSTNRGSPGAPNDSCRQVRCGEAEGERDVRPPAAGELAVVEVYADAPEGDAGKEWLEVRSVAPDRLDLNGLDIIVRKSDSTSERRTQVASRSCLVVEPGALIVIGSGGDGTSNGGVNVGAVVPELSFFDGAALEIELRWGDEIVDVAHVPASASGASWLLAGTDDLVVRNDDPASFCVASTRGIFEGAGSPACPNSCEAGCVDDSGCARPVRYAATGVLLLSEVFANPDGDDGGREWVELLVAGSEAIDLNGLEVVSLRPESGRSRRVRIENERCLEAGPGAWVLLAGPVAQEEGVLAAVTLGSRSSDLFYNTGASVSLWRDEVLLDETQVVDAQAGVSYSRDFVAQDPSAPTWCWPAEGASSFVGGVGTPGGANAPCL